MLMCSYVFDTIVRNLLVLLLLNSVPASMSYDVICIDILMLYCFVISTLGGGRVISLCSP